MSVSLFKMPPKTRQAATVKEKKAKKLQAIRSRMRNDNITSGDYFKYHGLKEPNIVTSRSKPRIITNRMDKCLSHEDKVKVSRQVQRLKDILFKTHRSRPRTTLKNIVIVFVSV